MPGIIARIFCIGEKYHVSAKASPKHAVVCTTSLPIDTFDCRSVSTSSSLSDLGVEDLSPAERVDIEEKQRGVIQFLPLILLILFSTAIFIVVNQVQKRQQDIRSRAENVYPQGTCPPEVSCSGTNPPSCCNLPCGGKCKAVVERCDTATSKCVSVSTPTLPTKAITSTETSTPKFKQRGEECTVGECALGLTCQYVSDFQMSVCLPPPVSTTPTLPPGQGNCAPEVNCGVPNPPSCCNLPCGGKCKPVVERCEISFAGSRCVAVPTTTTTITPTPKSYVPPGAVCGGTFVVGNTCGDCQFGVDTNLIGTKYCKKAPTPTLPPGQGNCAPEVNCGVPNPPSCCNLPCGGKCKAVVERCDTATSKCVPVPTPTKAHAAGEQCQSWLGNECRGCPYGVTPGFIPGMAWCSQPKQKGEECQPGECADGLPCAGGPTTGGKLYCGGLPAEKKPDGATCLRSDECASGNCSDKAMTGQGLWCGGMPGTTIPTNPTTTTTIANDMCGGCPTGYRCAKSFTQGYQCVPVSTAPAITIPSTKTSTPAPLVLTVTKAPRVPLPSGPYTCTNAPGLPPGKGGEIINGGACIVYECDGSTGLWVNRSKDGYNYSDLTNPGGIGPNNKTATCINEQALKPTPDPQHPAKRSCSNNYGNVVSELPDGAVSIGPLQNGNNRWKCVDGQWLQCAGCMLTVVPDYLQNDPAFLAEQKKYNDAVLAAEQLYSTTYQDCINGGKLDADCTAAAQKALDDAKNYTQQMRDAAVQSYTFNKTLNDQYYPLLETYNLCLTQYNNEYDQCADIRHKLNLLAGSQGLSYDDVEGVNGYDTVGYQNYLQDKLVHAYFSALNTCVQQQQSSCPAADQVLNYPGITDQIKATIKAISVLQTQYNKTDEELCHGAPIQYCDPAKIRADLLANATNVPQAYKDSIKKAYDQQQIITNQLVPAADSYAKCITNGGALTCSNYQAQALAACKDAEISETACKTMLDQQVYQTRDYAPLTQKYLACDPFDAKCKSDIQKQVVAACKSAHFTDAECQGQLDDQVSTYYSTIDKWKKDPNAALTEGGLSILCAQENSHECSDQELADLQRRTYERLGPDQQKAYDEQVLKQRLAMYATKAGYQDYLRSHNLQNTPDALLQFDAAQEAAKKRFMSTVGQIFPPGSKEYNDYVAKIQSGEINLEGAEAAYEATKHANLFNLAVVKFNEWSNGATKQGNDIQMAAVASFQAKNKGTIFDNGWIANGYLVLRTIETVASPFTVIPQALGIGGNTQPTLAEQASVLRGSVEKGALPAAAGVAIFALPAAFVITAPATIATAFIVGSTTLGVAGTTASLQQVAQYCDGTKAHESACIVSVVNTGIAAAGTAIGVGAGQTQLAKQLANVAAKVALSKAEQAVGTEVFSQLTDQAVQASAKAVAVNMSQIAGVQRVFSAVSAGWFGYQAANTCFGENRNTAACATNVLLTLGSIGQFTTSLLEQAQPITTALSKGSALVDTAANGSMALSACLLSEGRDIAGCAQSLGMLAVSVHGTATNLIGGEGAGAKSAETKLDEAMAEYEKASPENVTKARENYEAALQASALEKVQITKAMELVSGKDLLTGEKFLIDKQTAYTDTSKAYEEFVAQYGIKPSQNESPDITVQRVKLQTARDAAIQDLFIAKAAALHEDELANKTSETLPEKVSDAFARLVGREPEDIAAFRSAQDAFKKIAATASPDSVEYQVAEHNVEDAQREILIANATPKDIAIEEQQAVKAIVAVDNTEKARLEDELQTLTPEKAKAIRDAALSDLLMIKNNQNASQDEVLEAQRRYNNAQAVFEYASYRAAQPEVEARFNSRLDQRITQFAGNLRDRIFGSKPVEETTIPPSQSERRLSVAGGEQQALAKALQGGSVKIENGKLVAVDAASSDIKVLAEKVNSSPDQLGDTVKSLQYEAARAEYQSGSDKIKIGRTDTGKVEFTADPSLPPDVRNVIDSINKDLRTAEKLIGEKTNNPDFAIRGDDFGAKDQMRVIADAMFSGDPKSMGRLYESVTGSGKSSLMIPLIAELKAQYSGRDVVMILPSEKDVTDMFQKFPEDVFKGLGIEATRYNQSTEVGGTDFQNARILVTTKDVIFDSIRPGVSSEAVMSRVRGAVLVADESQLTLRLDTDYNITDGPQKPIVQMANGQHYIDVYKEVETTSSDLISRAQKEPGLVIRSGGKGVITDTALLESTYQKLLGDRMATVEDIARSQNVPFEQALDMYLNTKFTDPQAITVQQTVRERIAAFNSITKVLADVPTGFGIDEEGRVVPYDGGINNGRKYSSIMDALAYESVGKMRLGMSDTIDLTKVMVSGTGTTTNYGEFLKNFSEIYGFSGTPDILKKQFAEVYGISLSVGTQDQSTLVFGSNAVHPIAGITTARDPSVISIAAPDKGTARNIVVADPTIDSNDIVTKMRVQHPDVDVVVLDPNGGYSILSGDTTQTFKSLEAIDAYVKDNYYGANPPKEFIRVFKYGTHYGTDTTQLPTDQWTVVAGNETDKTTFLQGIGRDRGVGGYAKDTTVILLGQRDSYGAISQDEFLTMLNTNETKTIRQVELDGISRIVDNKVVEFIRQMEAADTASGNGKGASFYEGLVDNWRARSELDYSVGTGESRGVDVLTDKFKRAQEYILSLKDQIPSSGPVQDVYNTISGGGAVIDTLNLEGKGTQLPEFVPFNDAKSIIDLKNNVELAVAPGDIPATIARGVDRANTVYVQAANNVAANFAQADLITKAEDVATRVTDVTFNGSISSVDRAILTNGLGAVTASLARYTTQLQTYETQLAAAQKSGNQTEITRLQGLVDLTAENLENAKMWRQAIVAAKTKIGPDNIIDAVEMTADKIIHPSTQPGTKTTAPVNVTTPLAGLAAAEKALADAQKNIAPNANSGKTTQEIVDTIVAQTPNLTDQQRSILNGVILSQFHRIGATTADANAQVPQGFPDDTQLSALANQYKSQSQNVDDLTRQILYDASVKAGSDMSLDSGARARAKAAAQSAMGVDKVTQAQQEVNELTKDVRTSVSNGLSAAIPKMNLVNAPEAVTQAQTAAVNAVVTYETTVVAAPQTPEGETAVAKTEQDAVGAIDALRTVLPQDQKPPAETTSQSILNDVTASVLGSLPASKAPITQNVTAGKAVATSVSGFIGRIRNFLSNIHLPRLTRPSVPAIVSSLGQIPSKISSWFSGIRKSNPTVASVAARIGTTFKNIVFLVRLWIQMNILSRPTFVAPLNANVTPWEKWKANAPPLIKSYLDKLDAWSTSRSQPLKYIQDATPFAIGDPKPLWAGTIVAQAGIWGATRIVPFFIPNPWVQAGSALIFWRRDIERTVRFFAQHPSDWSEQIGSEVTRVLKGLTTFRNPMPPSPVQPVAVKPPSGPIPLVPKNVTQLHSIFTKKGWLGNPIGNYIFSIAAKIPGFQDPVSWKDLEPWQQQMWDTGGGGFWRTVNTTGETNGLSYVSWRYVTLGLGGWLLTQGEPFNLISAIPFTAGISLNAYDWFIRGPITPHGFFALGEPDAYGQQTYRKTLTGVYAALMQKYKELTGNPLPGLPANATIKTLEQVVKEAITEVQRVQKAAPSTAPAAPAAVEKPVAPARIAIETATLDQLNAYVASLQEYLGLANEYNGKQTVDTEKIDVSLELEALDQAGRKISQLESEAYRTSSKYTSDQALYSKINTLRQGYLNSKQAVPTEVDNIWQTLTGYNRSGTSYPQNDIDQVNQILGRYAPAPASAQQAPAAVNEAPQTQPQSQTITLKLGDKVIPITLNTSRVTLYSGYGEDKKVVFEGTIPSGDKLLEYVSLGARTLSVGSFSEIPILGTKLSQSGKEDIILAPIVVIPITAVPPVAPATAPQPAPETPEQIAALPEITLDTTTKQNSMIDEQVYVLDPKKIGARAEVYIGTNDQTLASGNGYVKDTFVIADDPALNGKQIRLYRSGNAWRITKWWAMDDPWLKVNGQDIGKGAIELLPGTHTVIANDKTAFVLTIDENGVVRMYKTTPDKAQAKAIETPPPKPLTFGQKINRYLGKAGFTQAYKNAYLSALTQLAAAKTIPEQQAILDSMFNIPVTIKKTGVEPSLGTQTAIDEIQRTITAQMFENAVSEIQETGINTATIAQLGKVTIKEAGAFSTLIGEEIAKAHDVTFLHNLQNTLTTSVLPAYSVFQKAQDITNLIVAVQVRIDALNAPAQPAPVEVSKTPGTDYWIAYFENQLAAYQNPPNIEGQYTQMIADLKRLQANGINIPESTGMDKTTNMVDLAVLQAAISAEIQKLPPAGAGVGPGSTRRPSGQALYAFDQSFVWFMELTNKAGQLLKTGFDTVRNRLNRLDIKQSVQNFWNKITRTEERRQQALVKDREDTLHILQTQGTELVNGQVIERNGAYYRVKKDASSTTLVSVVPIVEETYVAKQASEYPHKTGHNNLPVLFDGTSYYFQDGATKREITENGISFDNGVVLRRDKTSGGVVAVWYNDTLYDWRGQFNIRYSNGMLQGGNIFVKGEDSTLWMKNGEVQNAGSVDIAEGDVLTLPSGDMVVVHKTDNGYVLDNYFDQYAITDADMSTFAARFAANNTPELVAYVRAAAAREHITLDNYNEITINPQTGLLMTTYGNLYNFLYEEDYTRLLSSDTNSNNRYREELVVRRALIDYLLAHDPVAAALYKKYLDAHPIFQDATPITAVDRYDFEIKKLETLAKQRKLTPSEKQYLSVAQKLKHMWELVSSFSPDAIPYMQSILDELNPSLKSQFQSIFDQMRTLQVQDTPLFRSYIESKGPALVLPEQLLGFLPLAEPFTWGHFVELAYGRLIAPESSLQTHQQQMSTFWNGYFASRGIQPPGWFTVYTYNPDDMTFLTRVHTTETNVANMGGRYFLKGDFSSEELTHFMDHEATHKIIVQDASPRSKPPADFNPVPSEQYHNEIVVEFFAQMETTGNLSAYPPDDRTLFHTSYQEGTRALIAIFQEIDQRAGVPMYSLDLLVRGVIDYNAGTIADPLQYVAQYYTNTVGKSDFSTRLANYTDQILLRTPSQKPEPNPHIIEKPIILQSQPSEAPQAQPQVSALQSSLTPQDQPQNLLEKAAKNVIDNAADAAERAIEEDCSGQGLRFLPQVYAQAGDRSNCTIYGRTLKTFGVTKGMIDTFRADAWKMPNRKELELLRTLIQSYILPRPPVVAQNTITLLAKYLSESDLVAWDAGAKRFYTTKDNSSLPLFLSAKTYSINKQGNWVDSSGKVLPETESIQLELEGLLTSMAKKNDTKEAFFADLDTLFGVSFTAQPTPGYAFTPPPQWMLDTLRSDPHIISVGYTDPTTDLRREALTPDLSKLSANDREAFEIFINTLRNYLFGPVIVDTFGNHEEERQSWLKDAQHQIATKRSQSDANQFFVWVSNNKLSGISIGDVANSILAIDAIYPRLLDPQLVTMASTLHVIASGNVYDTFSIEEKQAIVAEAEELAWSALEAIMIYGKATGMPVAFQASVPVYKSTEDLPLDGKHFAFNRGHTYFLQKEAPGFIQPINEFLLSDDPIGEGTRAIVSLDQARSYIAAHPDKKEVVMRYISHELGMYTVDELKRIDGYLAFFNNKINPAVIQLAVEDADIYFNALPHMRSNLVFVTSLGIPTQDLSELLQKVLATSIQDYEHCTTPQYVTQVRARLEGFKAMQNPGQNGVQAQPSITP